MKNKTVFLIGILGVAGILCILFIRRISDKDDSWEDSISDGILIVGMDASYPPFESIDPLTNDIVGFDAELSTIIGERAGVSIQLVNIAYDGLYDALLIGQVDMLVSGLVDAPEYYGKAEFSRSYFNAGETLLFRTDEAVMEMSSLSNMTVGVEYGSGGDVEANQWQKRIENLYIERFDTPDAVVEALLVGDIDAAILDGISARLYSCQNENIILGESINEKNFAIAFHKDSDALRAGIGRILDDLLEDGTIDMLIMKWFS